jgi:hypothetical protein
VRSIEEIETVHALVAEGFNDCAISRQTGIPRTTIREWRHGNLPRSFVEATAGRSCPDCGHPEHDFSALPGWDYAYLFGLYLGDGSIVHCHRGVFRLSVTLDLRYPLIILACAASMMAVRGRKPSLAPSPGCTNVTTFWKSWPCLFPQHGPGVKHLRPIVVTDWQQKVIDRYPEPFIRGLIQSDGWRGTNRVTVNGKRYAYPRYNFSNTSEDILGIFTAALDYVGIDWRRMNAKNISVAKRASVARLDEFVGPKF